MLWIMMRMLKGLGSETFSTIRDWNLSMSAFTRLRALTLTKTGEVK